MLLSDSATHRHVRSRPPHRKMDARPEHATDQLIVPDTRGVGTNWTLPKDRRVITGGNQLAIDLPVSLLLFAFGEII